jgi:hypothetical protein
MPTHADRTLLPEWAALHTPVVATDGEDLPL